MCTCISVYGSVYMWNDLYSIWNTLWICGRDYAWPYGLGVSMTWATTMRGFLQSGFFYSELGKWAEVSGLWRVREVAGLEIITFVQEETCTWVFTSLLFQLFNTWSSLDVEQDNGEMEEKISRFEYHEPSGWT